MAQKDISTTEIDERITFHDDDQIMEVSFAGMELDSSTQVNLFYDRIEERIAASGEKLWFFLVDYRETRIDSTAWFAFSRRGKELNMAHSMGSVRFDASEITRKQIEQNAGTENFDPNLFYDRDSAVARLRSLPSKRQAKVVHTPTLTVGDVAARLSFLHEEQVMEVDFTDLALRHSGDVDLLYDVIEEKIGQTRRKWYFLINYERTRIHSPAWVRYAARGKRLNINWSLGSVRYAPGSETEADIRLRAESQDFRPNIRNTRAEALERIAEMKAEALQH
ncbi:hypothetical protein [Aliiroseovarius sp.]|uniref:hypothetical protein n=1 Tax=Aliiroseovarius sp. TaxID=1872442 RepID=UPI0026140F2C|nr:hypothetical protein [Aliiroseovarius sp.]